MSRLFSLFSRRQDKCTLSTPRKAAPPQRFRPGVECLERRDVLSTFLQVVTTPNYGPGGLPIGTYDALSVTVNNQQHQFAGIQFGVKVASSASALPGNKVPDFYSLCVDVTQMANLTSAYQVTPAPSSTIPHGAAVAYLYDTFNTPVGSPLDKTHAAALQLAIWETEYDNNIATDNVINNWLAGQSGGIVTPSDKNYMDTAPGGSTLYNGPTVAAATTETNAMLSDAAHYLSQVPSNPTNSATVLGTTGSAPQSLLGPVGQIAVTKTADAASITPGQTAGFTVTITNNGPTTDTGVALSDPLPGGAASDINWKIDTTTGNPTDFQISGAVGSQSLALSSTFVNALGDSLAPGQSIAVHITGVTSANDAAGMTPALGAAAGYTVLYSGTGGHNLSITNVTIGGNVGVGGTGQVQFSGPGTIGGKLDFAAANTGQYHNNNGANVGPTSVNYNVGAVTTALNTVNSLNSSLAGKGNNLAINGTQTINESAGQLVTLNGVTYRVFNVTSYSENDGKIVTINGDGSGDPVVFNFGFNSNVNLGGDVALSGGLTEDQVLWNFTTSGKNVQLNNNASSYPPSKGFAFRGILLAPNDAISVVNTSLVGRIFGGGNSDMQIVSGDTIKTPPTTGNLVNIATVTANNVTAQSATATIAINSQIVL